LQAITPLLFFVSLVVALTLLKCQLIKPFVKNAKSAFNAVSCFGISFADMPTLAGLAGEIMREPLRKGVFACNDGNVAW
jgi:hypothetical protein